MSAQTREAAPDAERAAGPRRQYLHEIDGLRGVAIVVIAVYHIWFNRVSGGVDVFLLLSGFFITGSLLRGIESGRGSPRSGTRPGSCGASSPALTVAACTVLMTWIWLPRATWNQQIGDILASAVYIGNWRLAESSVDYLSSNNGASIVQHYWSLGIQAQFYLLWPILIAACAFIASCVGARPRTALAIAFTAVFAGSFAFAIWETEANQAYAYFDTRARMWQFALGALLVLGLPASAKLASRGFAPLRFGRRAAAAVSWLALAALVTGGMLLTSTEFPGLAALWPVAAAAAIVAVATAQPGIGAGRLLNTRPLQALGRLSYTLYLWHWPVLICYLAATGRDTASPLGGLGIVAVSSRWRPPPAGRSSCGFPSSGGARRPRAVPTRSVPPAWPWSWPPRRP
ncbi:hypothetical protein GCM10029992_18190 [Glycomyces albus]